MTSDHPDRQLSITALSNTMTSSLITPAGALFSDLKDAICGLFFLDFLLSFYHAERKAKYLVTWGWIDLLSSIPTVDALRWGPSATISSTPLSCC